MNSLQYGDKIMHNSILMLEMSRLVATQVC